MTLLVFVAVLLAGCQRTITVTVTETPIENSFTRICTYQSPGMPYRTVYSASIEPHETCEMALWNNWGAR